MEGNAAPTPRKIYQQISAYLLEQIENGRLKLGDAIYSEHMLCRLFNASRTSVRRAIREMVENNILESRQGVGTFVKSTSLQKSIALLNCHTRGLMENMLNTRYQQLVCDVENEITAQNSRCLIYSGVIRCAAEIATRTAHLKADGIILDGEFQNNFDDLGGFQRVFPACTVLDGNPDETTLPSVAPDFVPSFIRLLQTVRKTRKNDRILFLYQERLARRRWCKVCFEQAVQQLKLQDAVDYVAYDNEIYDPSINILNPDLLLKPILERHILGRNCRVVINTSDDTAMHVIQLLRNQGYQIPDDVAVSGVYGLKLSEMTMPPLTTIRVPSRLMAAAAVKSTLDQFFNRQVSQRILLPTAVFFRSSLPEEP